MANRSWRNELNNRSNYMYGSTYGAPITYNQPKYEDRRSYPNRGGYQEDLKRGKRTYDNIAAAPKPIVRDNNNSNFRRNYNAPAVPSAAASIPAPAPNVIKKPIVKYSVKPPRVTFDVKEGSLSVLRSRYPKLYVPSDFFHSDFRWQDVFPLYTPFALGNETKFQMLHRDVEPLIPFDNARLNPSDANYKYSAKVMLLESIDMNNLIKSVCEPGSDKKNIYKSLNFLVGSKAKNEPLAIGGAWSPSLDGPNPDEDPQVLINTAIRTCKELTSIDLTPCKEWYRFVEFHYYRPADRQGLDISNDNDENRTENENDFRVETVVIFVPSVWDCMPDEDSWEDIKTSYSMALEAILMPPLPEPAVEIVDSEDKKDDNSENPAEVEEKEANNEESKEDDSKEDTKEVVEEKLTEAAIELKVTEPVKELTEKDKKRLEQLYKLNETSSIVVHANNLAKNGKFSCQFMSLGSLLEYRADDQKEHTFEISMFAEQFQEMLQRDAAFMIYKTLLKMPKQVDLDKADNEPDAKRRKEDTELSNKATKIENDLLLSFCVFDIDHADFIKDHDLEDIIQAIGLELSRSQARKLVSKAVNRKGAIYYRQLVLDNDEEVPLVSDMELSRGNKSKLHGTDEHTVYTGSAKTAADDVKQIESTIKALIAEFDKTKSELESSRAIYHTSKDLENSLRTQLKDLEGQLSVERRNVREATQNQDAYNGLLRMARDVLERAKSKIDRQFEKEAEKDKPKEVSVVSVNGEQ